MGQTPDALTTPEEVFDPLTGELLDGESAYAAQPGWKIDGTASLDWALMRLAALEAKAASNQRLAGVAHHRIDQWVVKENTKLTGHVAFLESHIATYAEANRATLLAAGGKTAKFPNGDLSWRKCGGGLRVVDEVAYYEWAVGLGHYRKTLDAAAARKAAEALPTPPPGTARTPTEDRLTIVATGLGLITKEK